MILGLKNNLTWYLNIDIESLTELRASLYTLEIECGRYTKPKTEISKRICYVCNFMEDEVHFLGKCKLYEFEQKTYFDKITKNTALPWREMPDVTMRARNQGK